MNPTPESSWNPDPQLLAAYFDGELEGCAGLADLRARVEAWLEDHPEGLNTGTDCRRLRKVLFETAPVEPDDEAWKTTLDRIDNARRRLPTKKTPIARNPWWGAAACVVGLALGFGALFGALRYLTSPGTPHEHIAVAPPEKFNSPAAAEVEVFPVATADEVLILRVEGRDTESLVVGELPMRGPMELADPGEVEVFVVRPDERDRPARVRQDSGSRPMIYARLDSERE